MCFCVSTAYLVKKHSAAFFFMLFGNHTWLCSVLYTQELLLASLDARD